MGILSDPNLREMCANTELFIYTRSPYFPVFGLNTEIYTLNLRNHSEYRKVQTRNKSLFEHFSSSDIFVK